MSDLIPPEKHEVQVAKGRKTKLTKVIVEAMYINIKLGVPKKRAAMLVGVSEATFYNWMSKAKTIMKGMEEGEPEIEQLSDDDYLFLELLESVSMAEAEFIAEGVKVIKREGPAGYRWLLSRMHPEEYGDKLQVDGSIKEQMTYQIKLPGKIGDAEDESETIEGTFVDG